MAWGYFIIGSVAALILVLVFILIWLDGNLFNGGKHGRA